ncbi:predicted protein [Lichtheimia corymbifera JMRC:FSU:9682]|uniref:Uncharacterized protein n=1 Tax=Lichtheimia corymbifera JMRC:FSU:9682 TaxID=1263082 RepID=A0A068RW15_9FUNG|nr:predicted protein [Lichtheimia corymbifera JMRC:FSU:9682]
MDLLWNHLAPPLVGITTQTGLRDWQWIYNDSSILLCTHSASSPWAFLWTVCERLISSPLPYLSIASVSFRDRRSASGDIHTLLLCPDARKPRPREVSLSILIYRTMDKVSIDWNVIKPTPNTSLLLPLNTI